jgi:predicted PurR-regulated permease PerM
MKSRTIVPRAEIGLLCILGLGFLLVLQTWFFALYRIGMIIIIAATLLNIAVGNLPRDAGLKRAVLLTLMLLSIIGFVFGLGIFLVPYLAQLGQSS